ncbi:phosphopyruvate hydratase [Candidatus Woesearchaeota archaeon]|nr:phosphopyruvate hydratase [Candidatus Woesearchaeota archaeon]
MARIIRITAREILDSRGNPTVEATVVTSKGIGVASVPSGASTGVHEACELRDGGKRYGGKGVLKAVAHINGIIAPSLKGKDCGEQFALDQLLCSLDGTSSKKKLGANAILAVSLACARATAVELGQPLYVYLHSLVQSRRSLVVPRLFFNIINGGKHADNSLAFQEFMIVPRMKTARENVRVASEVYHVLKKNLHQQYGLNATNVGDEGGFAPPVRSVREALDVLVKAIADAGYKGKVDIALDCAASEFYNNGKYIVDGTKLGNAELLKLYLDLVKKYPIISIEDPFEQEDFESFALLRERVAKQKVQVVGDDLTVTNVRRIRMALGHKSISCLLLKVNQIGTLSEAIAAADLMFSESLGVMVSHRSGETTDTFIADLAVALGCGQIKAGAPCRGERVAKYNRLMEIEEGMN